MSDTHYCRVGEKHALAYDRFQWVLQRRSMRKGNEDWKAVAFINTTKYHLFAAMIRYGVPKDDALHVCEPLPETFIEFLAEISAEGGRSASDSAVSSKEVAEEATVS